MRQPENKKSSEAEKQSRLSAAIVEEFHLANSTVLVKANNQTNLTSVPLLSAFAVSPAAWPPGTSVPLRWTRHDADRAPNATASADPAQGLIDTVKILPSEDHRWSDLEVSLSSEDYAPIVRNKFYTVVEANVTTRFTSLKDAQMYEAGLELREVRPVSYYMKKDVESKNLAFGFIAQELAEVYPNLVKRLGDGTLAVAYTDILAILTLSVQQKMLSMDNVETRLGLVADKIVRRQAVSVHRQAKKVQELEAELRKLKREAALEKAAEMQLRRKRQAAKASSAEQDSAQKTAGTKRRKHEG
jgi:hypothetical protein